jgi:CHAT domain-containing protein
MARFFGRLGRESAADPLRAAKLEMSREGKPPNYWLPFILIGE